MKFLLAFLTLNTLWQPTLSRRPTAHDFKVKGLVDVAPAFAHFEGDMYAGVLPVTPLAEEDNPDDGHLMFWHFDAEKPLVDDSLIVWFNGGPGCSSFDAGLLFEFVSSEVA